MNFSKEKEYDAYLLSGKQGRIKRVDQFLGMSKNIKHQCTDAVCGRVWKPCPKQICNDDYYCPSCVLHHRNNIDRFAIDRLKWTKEVPNTFYLYNLTDPKNEKSIVKFGRTQHTDSKKRYPAKEIKEYKMSLIKQWRGRLEDTTKAENWWKTEAGNKNLFYRFSDEKFHGVTECVDLTENVLKDMIKKTNELI